MKNWSKFLIGACVVALSASCSEKELNSGKTGPDNVNPKDAVYMNVAVQLPVGPGTRSVTNPGGGSNNGTEVGKDYENLVKSILLVLADEHNKFIAYGEHMENINEVTNGKVSTVHTITKSTLKKYYGDDNTLTEAERAINVFVFCNPTAELGEYIETVSKGTDAEKAGWYNAACKINEQPDGTSDNDAIWGGPAHKNGFLMSVADITKICKKLPAKFSEWDSYTTIDKAFNLSGMNNAYTDKEINNGGAIPVERAVARFDFRDGSPNGHNTYDVVTDKEGQLLVQIELQKMALVNMSKEFYYLRRVSPTGNDDDNVLCGIETPESYVMDTDAAAKRDDAIIAGNTYADHFNFCLGHVAGDKWTIDETARNQWFTSKTSDILGGEEDNDEGWKPAASAGYHIWRYVTENTVPSATMQKNGISTGIVFKGKMLAAESASGSLAEAIKNVTGTSEDAILYSYSNNIYVTWKEVRALAIEEGQGSELYQDVFGKNMTSVPVAEKPAEGETAAVEAVYSDDVDSPDYLWNVWHNVNGHDAGHESLAKFKKAATSAKFTLYESSLDAEYGAGYYCYYFYWNRHNDNGNSGVMSPMEFAVVRNNVYKLAVTNINRLGHPRISDNNPDPVDPDDPDEKGDVYLTVSVEVLPWTVRVNNIEF